MQQIIELIIYMIIFNIFFMIINFYTDILCLISYFIFRILESICKNLFHILFKRFIINIINILFFSGFIDLNIIQEVIYNNIKSPIKVDINVDEEKLDERALRHRRKCQAIEERLKQIEKENKYAIIGGVIAFILLIVFIKNLDNIEKG